MKTRTILFLLPTLLFCMTAFAETTYQPFVLASVNDSNLATQTQATMEALNGAGFTLAGQYSPVENANVLVKIGRAHV